MDLKKWWRNSESNKKFDKNPFIDSSWYFSAWINSTVKKNNILFVNLKINYILI